MGDHGHEGDDVADLTGHKVGAMATLIVIGAGGVALPYLFRISGTTKKVTRYIQAFAGGAFIGLALFHLFPDAITMLDEAKLGLYSGESFYNLTYLLAVCGLLTVLFAERVITAPSCLSRKPTERADLEGGLEAESPTDGGDLSSASKQKESQLECVPPTKSFNRGVAPFVVLASISLHSLFEGTVVGVSDSVPLIWVATGAITAHKWVEGFALSSLMQHHGLSRIVRFVCAACFVLASPIGLLIGMTAFNAAGSSGTAVAGVCNGFSLGMILFVGIETTLEVLSSDDTDDKDRATTWSNVIAFLLVALGCFVVFALFLVHLQYHVHDHGDGHDCHDQHDHH